MEQNYGKRMIKETVEIEKLIGNFNKEDIWKISYAQKPIINNIRRITQWRQPEKEIDSHPDTD